MITSCTEEQKQSASQFKSDQNMINIAYGSDSLHRMDIFLPANRSADHTKSIVLIHGGGWSGGSRSEFNPYIDTIKQKLPGYAIFNLSYRLINGRNLFPVPEEDIKSAMDHIVENSEDYGISKNDLVLLGFSAGGHLALLHSYKNDDPKIKAVISFFGPTDLETMYREPWHPYVPLALQMVTGTTPSANSDIYKTSSPINYVDSNSPPTLLIHGTQDKVVDISQSRSLQKKLQQEGVGHELLEHKGLGHGWRGEKMHESFKKVQAFLNQWVN